ERLGGLLLLAALLVPAGQACRSALKPNELGAVGVAVFLKPVGVDESRSVLVGVGANRPEESGFVGHGRGLVGNGEPGKTPHQRPKVAGEGSLLFLSLSRAPTVARHAPDQYRRAVCRGACRTER